MKTQLKNMKTEKIIEQANKLDQLKGKDLDGLKNRDSSQLGLELLNEMKKTKKDLDTVVGDFWKELNDLETKMQTFKEGKTGLISGNKEYIRMKKEDFLKEIVLDKQLEGMIYFEKGIFSSMKKYEGKMIAIHPRTKEYIIEYSDGNSTKKEKVSKICEE